MRTIFMGTGDIGLPTLRFLLSEKSGTDLVAVVTGEDTLFGRPPKLKSPEIKTVSEEAGVQVFQPAKLPEIQNDLEALEPELIVVMAYGQILRKEVLELPTLACINLHASILPRHRGASPINSALLVGDSQSGVTVMHMARGLDTGDMIHTEEINLGPEMTGGELHDALGEIAPLALEHALSLRTDDSLPRTPQEETDATYAGKLSRADGEMDWTKEPVVLERMVRAYHPWPGTWTTFESKGKKKKPRRLKILPSVVAVTKPMGCPEPGTLIAIEEDHLLIAAGEGALRIRSVQPEGARAMSVPEFLNGTPLEVGDRLGSD